MSEKEKKEWRPSFPQYSGQKMPELTDRDIQKNAYRERRRREQEYFRLSKETLRNIQKINEELQSQNLQDIRKSEVNAFREKSVNDLIRKILKGR